MRAHEHREFDTALGCHVSVDSDVNAHGLRIEQVSLSVRQREASAESPPLPSSAERLPDGFRFWLLEDDE